MKSSFKFPSLSYCYINLVLFFLNIAWSVGTLKYAKNKRTVYVLQFLFETRTGLKKNAYYLYCILSLPVNDSFKLASSPEDANKTQATWCPLHVI